MREDYLWKCRECGAIISKEVKECPICIIEKRKKKRAEAVKFKEMMETHIQKIEEEIKDLDRGNN